LSKKWYNVPEGGDPMDLLTGSEMKRVDERAMAELGIPGVLLMETAGRRVFEAVAALGPLPGRPVVVACGRGNNGGDGFVAARHLDAAGARVHVLLLAKPEDYQGDAAVNLRLLTHTGASLKHILEDRDLDQVDACLQGAHAVVDALLGTGLLREVQGLYRQVITRINDFPGKVIAADIPSGIHADTGEVMGTAVKAWSTVTFAFPKKGLYFYPGKEHSGIINIADIFIPRFLGKQEGSNLYLSTPETVQSLLPPRRGDGHKGSCGRVLVLAGSPGFSGAAYLTSMAAQRSGAGLVTLGVPVGLHAIMAGKLVEVMTAPLQETAAGTLSSTAMDVLSTYLGLSDVLAFGPGLGRGEEIREILLQVLARYPKPMVIDADGLNALALGPEVLKQAACPPVLTPHPGEMARLTGMSVAEVRRDPVGLAREKARLWQAVLVLKGSPTVVAYPDGRVFLNPTGNDGMATGGTGDVLTGIIAGLIAQGSSAGEAAVAGTFVHGLAGDLAAARAGTRGMIATDVLEVLPKALQKIELHRGGSLP
jgi:ADP-dependent NAD(P)H-hydrate dehydratase / NAD(P)H-hydrate epimerase